MIIVRVNILCILSFPLIALNHLKKSWTASLTNNIPINIQRSISSFRRTLGGRRLKYIMATSTGEPRIYDLEGCSPGVLFVALTLKPDQFAREIRYFAKCGVFYMTGPSGPPLTKDEILSKLKAGEMSPADALKYLGQLQAGSSAHAPLRIVAQQLPQDKESEDAAKIRLDEAMADLERLIGLKYVKELVREVQAFVLIQKRRTEAHLVADPLALHMIFKGNPGTGKTTVARIFGRMFEAMGVLPKGHLIECERADLVGEYIGHTAQKTREKLKQAMGGILFIDEAYSLARGGEKDFGKEAIDTLVKAMEDHKDRLVLILAGYSREMEFFLDTNPGLRSRFPIHIEFSDYSTADLLKIASLMLSQREYRLTQSAKSKLEQILDEKKASRDDNLGNARMVRNLIERAIRRQAVRLVEKEHLSRTELLLITEADMEEVTVAE